MPDKKTAVSEDKDVVWDVKAQPQQPLKKIKGKVILIIPNKRVIVEYGEGFGTEIVYNESKHKSLKNGDIIEI